jgi:hypothetical protein
MHWADAIGGFLVCGRDGGRRAVLGRAEELVLYRDARAVWPTPGAEKGA